MYMAAFINEMGIWAYRRNERVPLYAYMKISIIAFGLLFALTAFAATSVKTVEAPQIETEIVAPAAVYGPEDALDAYLTRLAFEFECTGACARAVEAGEPFSIVDRNNKLSYGCLQFQEASWLYLSRKYGVDPWENGGIYQCENQRKVARAMFLEDAQAAARHWYTSIYVRGLGLPDIQ